MLPLPKISLPQVDVPLVIDPETVALLLFNTMVIYGPTGSFKTSQIGPFAKYIYEKTGKKTRLLTADGGGYGPVQHYVNAGIIEPWRVAEDENPKVAVRKASKGWWPKDIKNGLRTSNAFIVPQPGKMAEAFKDVGAYAVEGWASIASLIMRDSVTKGQKISEDVVSKFTETTPYGEETFGAPARAHYGFVQNYILDLIRSFSVLPMERILYTSLEGKGEEKLSKRLEYGPLVAGQAITAAIPTYVGDCLHFEDFDREVGIDPNNPKQKLVETGVRAWFVKHPDPETRVMWPAKARIIPEKIEEFKRSMGSQGYFEIVQGKTDLETYLRTQDKVLQIGSDEVKKWKETIDRARASK